jgi:hypothetical protein
LPAATLAVLLLAAGCAESEQANLPPAPDAAAADRSAAPTPADVGGTDLAEDRDPLSCRLVGCSPPPLCAIGCTARCGCCPCQDGTVTGNLQCVGGCYVPLLDAGSADATDGDDRPDTTLDAATTH